jgi:hypothetical protein
MQYRPDATENWPVKMQVTVKDHESRRVRFRSVEQLVAGLSPPIRPLLVSGIPTGINCSAGYLLTCFSRLLRFSCGMLLSIDHKDGNIGGVLGNT